MEIEANDKGNPERVATLTLYITVLRSTRAPRVDDLPINPQRIAETKRVGEQVYKLRAHDPDLRVCITYTTNDILFNIKLIYAK